VELLRSIEIRVKEKPKFQRGEGSSQTHLEWKFQREWGVKMKKPSTGGRDIFWNYTIPL